MGLFGTDRQEQVVRVFRAACKNGSAIRAKLTVTFTKPPRAEAAEALADEAEKTAKALLAEAPNATILIDRAKELSARLSAALGERAEGSTFELEMVASSAAITTATEVRRARGEGHGTVLVVDDEESVRITIEGLLCDDHRVLLAASAADAEEVVLRERPDVVLADYELGGRTGLDLLARIRSICPEAIGMLITGHAEYAEVTAAMADDRIFRVILKPYDPESLVATVRTAVSIAKMRSKSLGN